MKTIVLISGNESVFIDELANNLLKDKTEKNIEIKKVFLNDAENQFKRDYGIDKPSKKHLIRWLKYRKKYCDYLCQNYDYGEDVIANIHYISYGYVFLLPYLKKCYSHIVVSFWGSDLLRQGKWKLKLLKPIFKLAKHITIQTDEMINIFNQKVGKGFDNKFVKIKFGLSTLSTIDELSDLDLMNFKTKYGLEEKKINVVVGYNRAREQQHDKAIKSIINNVDILEKIRIIIPWTYGNNDRDYRLLLEQLMKDKCEYCFFDNFLENKENACLRVISDYFIQVQTSDAFSGSMQEVLYAKNNVITGMWLPYEEMINLGVSLKRVEEVEQVGTALRSLIENPIEESLLENNKAVIGNLSSWDANVKRWLALYE